MSKCIDEIIIDHIYQETEDNLYSYRYFADLNTPYSFALGERTNRARFYEVIPNECRLKDLLCVGSHISVNSLIEQVISRITYSLLKYGKAYLYIDPTYKTKVNDNGKEEQVLYSIRIDEVKGCIKKRRKDFTFCFRAFDKSLHYESMSPSQIIVFDLRELGYRRRYFSSIIKKLGRLDIYSASSYLASNTIKGYDFSVHHEMAKLKELKIAKEIGWAFDSEKLSDSYIFYKKIQEYKLKTQILSYIMGQINKGLEDFLLSENDGKIVTNIAKIEYDKIWNEFCEGKKTISDMRDILLVR